MLHVTFRIFRLLYLGGTSELCDWMNVSPFKLLVGNPPERTCADKKCTLIIKKVHTNYFFHKKSAH